MFFQKIGDFGSGYLVTSRSFLPWSKPGGQVTQGCLAPKDTRFWAGNHNLLGIIKITEN